MNEKKILDKHHVKIINGSDLPYRLTFEKPPSTPNLDNMVHEWRDENGLPFSEQDIQARRVGLIQFFAYMDGFPHCYLYCLPISWGQHIIMIDRDKKKSLPPREVFGCLTISCLVITIDGKLLLALRSNMVNRYKNMWHVSVAGHIDLSTAVSSRSVIPQLFKELEEELGLLPSDMESVKQLGLCSTMDGTGTDVCMLAKTNLSSSVVIEKATKAADSWEGRISAVNLEDIENMLSEYSFVPGGAGTLCLFLRENKV